jgi:hypothetical protein
MKKVTIALLLSVTAVITLITTTFAATQPAPATGPFTGTFTGTVNGDRGSKTTLTLDLTDQDHTIAGTTSLGGGLVINAGGLCGTAVLPTSTLWAEGSSTAKHPDQLNATTTIDVGSFIVTVDVDGDLSADGETLDLTAKINTPFMCGRDPIITGTLTRLP